MLIDGQPRQVESLPPDNGSDSLSRLLSGLIHTREIRTLLARAIPEVLDAWAGDSRTKKTVSRMVGKNIQSGLTRPGDILQQAEVTRLFHQPEQIQNLSRQLPQLLDSLFLLAEEVGTGLETLDETARSHALQELIQGLFSGRSAKAITTWVRVLAAAQQESPDFLCKAIEPGITRWITQTDFGEIKDMLDGLGGTAEDLCRMVNEVIWKYPAKVVLLLSFLPAIFNMIVKAVNTGLEQFNNLAPDLVADVVLSLFRDIDPETFGQTINALSELVRKLDTGSSLIGDSGVSGGQRDIAGFLEKLLATIQVDTLLQASRGIAAGRETVSEKLHEILQDHPEIILGALSRSDQKWNPVIRRLNRKTRLLCDLPEKNLSEALSAGISQIDFSILAETINDTARLINQVRLHRPVLASRIASHFTNNLDTCEVENVLKGTIEDIGEAVRPLGATLFPYLVSMACDWLTEAEKGNLHQARQAREKLRNLILEKEVLS